MTFFCKLLKSFLVKPHSSHKHFQSIVLLHSDKLYIFLLNTSSTDYEKVMNGHIFAVATQFIEEVGKPVIIVRGLKTQK